jgi:hypothetical protein
MPTTELTEPTVGETLDETVPVVGVVPVLHGPVAAPFVLIGHIRRHRSARESLRAPATQLVPAASQWRAA